MESKVIEQAMYSYFKLLGKTAIVTGAGNGIGRGIAKVLASLGANVVACDIEKDSVEETVAQITEQGLNATAVYCDVRKYEDIQNVIKTAVDTYGTVDILVNDAAGCGGGVTIDNINEEEWMRLIELNLNSVYRFTMSVLPIMRAKKSGKIVNISSGAGIVGDFSDPHYAAAKGGVIAFPRRLPTRLQRIISILTVWLPGWLIPEWQESGHGKMKLQIRSGTEWDSRKISLTRLHIWLPQPAIIVPDRCFHLTAEPGCSNGASHG